jgi:cell pole-organizing protein PopZ
MPENPKSPSEPSMEEIIASISRIITDEKTSVEPVRPVPGEKSEILEQTWLDENLPRLVERLVREEIARVVGEAGLR